MALKITKQEYEKLIEQDLSILRKHLPDSPENDHIRLVLTNSIDMHYPCEGNPQPDTEANDNKHAVIKSVCPVCWQPLEDGIIKNMCVNDECPTNLAQTVL